MLVDLEENQTTKPEFTSCCRVTLLYPPYISSVIRWIKHILNCIATHSWNVCRSVRRAGSHAWVGPCSIYGTACLRAAGGAWVCDCVWHAILASCVKLCTDGQSQKGGVSERGRGFPHPSSHSSRWGRGGDWVCVRDCSKDFSCAALYEIYCWVHDIKGVILEQKTKCCLAWDGSTENWTEG